MMALALLAAAHFAYWYHPSPTQLRVDMSFSAIAIDTPLITARPFLMEQRENGCELSGECEWIDKDKVRYRFAGETPQRQWLVAKVVRASDYAWKSISALGIGLARERALVIRAVQRQVRGIQLDCPEPSGTGFKGISCRAALDPGWITLDFDERGQLIEVRLDGYHFT